MLNSALDINNYSSRALGSHLGRHLENDPFRMVRMKETFTMLKSIKIVPDSVDKPFVSIC